MQKKWLLDGSIGSYVNSNLPNLVPIQITYILWLLSWKTSYACDEFMDAETQILTLGACKLVLVIKNITTNCPSLTAHSVHLKEIMYSIPSGRLSPGKAPHWYEWTVLLSSSVYLLDVDFKVCWLCKTWEMAPAKVSFAWTEQLNHNWCRP